jgi:hypothetical protein
MTIAKTIAALAFVAACGSSTPAKMDGKPIDTPAGAPQLTVKNYLSWCSVSVNGGTASSGPMQSMNITAAGPITLVASPASATFKLGPNMWHHVDGDTGTGIAGTVAGSMSTATVTVTATASKCVWVCCPFQAGNGCESTLPDQCP